LGVEITSPAGSVSVKATPERLWVTLLFRTVKLSDVEPFSGMLAAPNDLVIAGGAVEVTVALEVLPVPPLAELT